MHLESEEPSKGTLVALGYAFECLVDVYPLVSAPPRGVLSMKLKPVYLYRKVQCYLSYVCLWENKNLGLDLHMLQVGAETFMYVLFGEILLLRRTEVDEKLIELFGINRRGSIEHYITT